MESLGTKRLIINTQIKLSYNNYGKYLQTKGEPKQSLKLREEAKISSSSMAELSDGGNVATAILIKICCVLACDINDIAEIIRE